MTVKPTYEELEKIEFEHKYAKESLQERALGELELSDFIDVPAVQSLMEAFHRITGMLSAIVDSNGKVLVAVGWQDICTKFHRCHPETQKNCVESDTVLACATEPGRFKSYRCKNGMWDMSSPIVVSGRQVGNIYFGQFIYSDEKLDVKRFRDQAHRYGFDEKEYLAALDRVPRYDRETVGEVMAFYSRLGAMISALSFSNVRLSRTLTEQKRTEAALKEKTQLLQNITDNMFDLVSVTDMKGNFIFLSASCKILNYDLDSLIGKNVLELVHPKDLPEISLRFSDLLSRFDDNQKVEYRYRCADGTYIWLETVGRFIRDDKGNPKEILFSSRDITERKFAEEKLVKEATRRHLLMEQSRDGIVILDQTGQVVESNRRFADMLNYPFESMNRLKVSDWEFLYPPDRLIEMINSVDEKGDHFETRHRRRDGSVYDVAISTNAAWFDEQKLIFCICRDITERKQAEEALRESEARFRSVYDHTAVGLVHVSLDLHIISANKAYHDMLGYKENDLIGRHLKEITHPDVIDENFQNQTKLASGEIDHYSMEKKFIHKNGQTVHAILDANLIRDALGNPTYFLGSVVNITERIQAAAEREKIQAQLTQAQKLESIGSLAGGIAHDFNNLLFPIVGLSEMMLDDFPPGSPEHSDAQQIFEAGKRGRALVHQILSFSRQSEYQRIPVHIQTILKEVFKLCRTTIPAEIPITQDIQIDCRPVMADPTQIHQIAMNLITNAFHAVEPTGGTISIQLKEILYHQKDTTADHLASGTYAMLSVSDTGTGIDPAIMNKIFDPYFTTKGKGRGTGLGLATVYGIVKAYGGDIRVDSEPGKGACFHVCLPVLETSEAKDIEKQPQPLPTGTEHILLVDDEKPIVQLEKQMLERLGYRTTCFSNSVDALAAFEMDPSQFDLVITDMHMPNLTGAHLAEKMIAVKPALPVIVCTGFSESINREKAAAMGIRGLLMKPVGLMDLARKIREVLDLKSG
jgi:PAS domain S-box-containing protein